jgi:predicted  nucleic acid-binding Zn-ribbon protein
MDRAASLYQLQQLDNDAEQARSRLAEIASALGESPALRQARQMAEKTVDVLRQRGVRQRDLELQLSTLRQKISDSERKLYDGSIRNPKVLQDRQEELASLKRRLERTEEELLEAMIEREDAEGAAEQARVSLETTEGGWAAAQENLSMERAQLEARLAEIEEVRNALLPAIPAGDLSVYQNLRRTKGDSAVALVRGGICTGCWMEVPPARLNRVRRGMLLSCDNCERVLVLEERL